ncbi:MAG: preprotein translocase subunit SecE [Candidatus Shapirobacteria bacterium]
MQKILQFLREVREEFHHITWPKRDALIQLTFVVISFSLVISLILGGFDYLFTQSIPLLTNLKTSPPVPTETIALPTINISTPSATPTIKIIKK